MALLMLLRGVKRDDITPRNGKFFQDCASVCTNFPNEVREMDLAHVVENAIGAAYRRGDLFDKRRKLTEVRAAFFLNRGKAQIDYIAI